MELKRITVKNFRCFENLTLDLHPELTVLIAPNGMGKTALLDAVRIAVWPFVEAFDLGTQTGKSATIQSEDVRLFQNAEKDMEAAVPSAITAYGSWREDKQGISWTQVRDSLKPDFESSYAYGPTSEDLTDSKEGSPLGMKIIDEYYAWESGPKALNDFGKELQKEIRREDRRSPLDLPAIVYLGTGRFCRQDTHSSDASLRKPDREMFSRTWGYRDCISLLPGYRQFEDWYSWVWHSYWEEHIRRYQKKGSPSDKEQRFQNIIRGVQAAVNELVEKETGWRDIEYSVGLSNQTLLSHPEHGDLPFGSLSDGLRNAVAMAADLAFRCSRLNPHHGAEAALKTEGIAMIDEVDLFLHPAWQQTIIGSLRRAFPKIQFIVTTHSPQVLSTVKSECIRILKDGQVYSAPKGTKGAEASRVLKRVLGVDVRPAGDENAILLNEYLDLVYAGKWDAPEAVEKRKSLDEIYGDEEPALTEADLYIENKKWEMEIEEDQ